MSTTKATDKLYATAMRYYLGFCQGMDYQEVYLSRIGTIWVVHLILPTTERAELAFPITDNVIRAMKTPGAVGRAAGKTARQRVREHCRRMETKQNV